MDLIKLIDSINKNDDIIGSSKVGAFKIFGKWFGKAFDNLHHLKGIDHDIKNNILTLTFDEDEILTIWEPKGVIISKRTLEISKASKIKLEWFLYGEKKNPENKRIWLFEVIFPFFIRLRKNKSCIQYFTSQKALEIL